MQRTQENPCPQALPASQDRIELPTTESFDCPYLPGQVAVSEMFGVSSIEPDMYVTLMDHGFRRSGTVIYRPTCPTCNACRQLRVPVKTFRPTRSQRRTWRRNADVVTHVGPPEWSHAKWQLFVDYLAKQHDGTMSDDPDAMRRFLYESPLDTEEITYFVGERLIGVSIVDMAHEAMSSVYMFFDPAEARRSLGTYSILWEIESCRRKGIAYYYLGFWVAGAATMDYKVRFQPCEVLDNTGTWSRIDRDDAAMLARAVHAPAESQETQVRAIRYAKRDGQ